MTPGIKILGNLVNKARMAFRDWRVGRKVIPRSPQWPAVRRAHLAAQPACQWCGSTSNAQVHHVVPFHLDRSRELDPKNLITLCENPGISGGIGGCHLERGHLGDWERWNPFVRADCAKHRESQPAERPQL